MTSRPFILGLTGSIGMGKSAVASMLRALGVPVFDADAAVHRLQAAGSALLPVIEAEFPGCTGPDGVRRAELGAQVFGDRAALARLEAIMHPAVAEERLAFLDEHGGEPLVVFDIPLLYERAGPKGLDAVAVVSAPAEMQRARVMARPGMTEAKFAQILGLQVPDAEKRARADHVIDTGVTLDETARAVESLVAALRMKNCTTDPR
jgi:dephospho-CoA kinase